MAEETPNTESAPQPDDEIQSATSADVDETVAQVSADSAQDAAEALDAASVAVDTIQAEAENASDQPLDLPALSAGSGAEEPAGLSLLRDVELQVKVELGRTRMFVEDVLRLNESSVVELDKAAGDPVDIFVNDRLIARGEVLVVNDSFCVRISEIIQEMPIES